MHSPKHALPRTGVGELSEGPTTSAMDNTIAASSCPEDESSVPDWDFPVWKILGAAWAGANEPFSVTQRFSGTKLATIPATGVSLVLLVLLGQPTAHI